MRLHQILTPSALSLLFLIAACSESVGPEQFGGETDLELTEIGNEFPVTIETGSFIPGLDQLEDSIVITGRDNGIVTVHGHMAFDSLFVVGLDSALGTSSLPDAFKLEILDMYLNRYNITIDTVDKQAMSAEVDVTLRVTSEGIQEFASSGGDMGRPFTIVRYDASVGDSWSFTTDDGREITRTVSYRSTEDDYPVAFWMIKVIKVEEVSDDPVVEKVTYVTNHKFGIVGVEIIMKSGETMNIGVLPPNL